MATDLGRAALADLIAERFDWSGWEATIEAHGVTIDRPRLSRHPVHPSIIYPLDYGFVNGTTSADGEEVDVFVGTAPADRIGLNGLIVTTDRRKGDQEAKLLFRCDPTEVYLVNGFINFDRRLMEGTLILRQPLAELWQLMSA